jgi:alpha-galactosidase
MIALSGNTQYFRLDAENTTFAIASFVDAPPRLIYFGVRLAKDEDLQSVLRAHCANVRESTPDAPTPASLFPTAGFGWMGESALSCHREGRRLFPTFSANVTDQDNAIVVTLTDTRNAILVELDFALEKQSGVLRTRTKITNSGADALTLDHLASLTLPAPDRFTDIGAFSGRWGRELQLHRFAAPPGQWAQINRTGRTGFSGASVLLLTPHANDSSGDSIALHLAFSGNHRLLIETQSDGSRMAMLRAEAPGEIVLRNGDTWTAPYAYAAASARGINGVRQALHRHVLTHIAPASVKSVRPVHFNTWEGAYFDVDEEKLLRLADAAADLGVERFVIDDGWFKGRVNDRAGLGDWTPDPKRFPSGLHTIATRVKAHGMTLGLWVEPEMVNADSDLYHAQPDWILHVDGAPRPTMRKQFTLNIARPDVRAHLLESISALLSAYPIEYLKWDCNRDAFPAADGENIISMAHMQGVYDLMDAVRSAFPDVEIEACASGGTRHDLAMLSRCARVWPSDATDPIERLRLMKWASLTTPLAMLGAHVGPSPNPMTGRRTSMDFRCKVAMFGHMGVELDPHALSLRDRDTLKKHIQLYKYYRPLLHNGALYAWSGEDGIDARMVVATDQKEALLLAVRCDPGAFAEAPPLCVPGLAQEATYEIAFVEPVPTRAQRRMTPDNPWHGAIRMSGAALAQLGVRLPLIDPMTALLLAITRAH